MRATFGLVMMALVAAGCSAEAIEIGGASEDLRGGADCDLVRCPMPLCAEGQHLSYRGGCCPTCVGRTDRCATVLCAAVECPEGQQRVSSPGDCCGHCVPERGIQECRTDDDCPIYYCIQCPCPVSECRGAQCVTWTPDASTCGGAPAL